MTALYQQITATSWLRTSDNHIVNQVPGNADYMAMMAWIAAGHQPADQIVPPVPPQITRWQAMAQMLATPSFVNPPPATVFSDVQASVVAHGGTVLLAWQNQQYVYRNGPFMGLIAPSLGLTSAILDRLFIAAAALPP